MELQIGIFDNVARKAWSRCVLVDGANSTPLVHVEVEPDGTVRRYTVEVQTRVTVERAP